MSHRSRDFLLLCLCTHRPEKILQAAIDSVLELDIPDGVYLELVVVDNSKQGLARPLITRLAASSSTPFTIHYTHEPTIGIAYARNRALDFALAIPAERQPKWLAFFDDDDLLDSSWLTSYHRYIVGQDLENRVKKPVVLTGPIYFSFPDGAPSWARKCAIFSPRKFVTGSRRPWAATGNVFFDIELIRDIGLRFEVKFVHITGEDQLFFLQATVAGAKIFWVDEARVKSLVPKHRLTRRWILLRNFAYGSTGYRITVEAGKWGKVMSYGVSLGKGCVYLGVGTLLLLPACLVAVVPSLHHMLIDALGLVSRGIGWLWGIGGRPYQYYRRARGQGGPLRSGNVRGDDARELP